MTERVEEWCVWRWLKRNVSEGVCQFCEMKRQRVGRRTKQNWGFKGMAADVKNCVKMAPLEQL